MDTSKHSVPRSLARLRQRAAFSLVEVTIAIGIVSFAFVSVLGLIPTGLTTFRRAMDVSIGSQIAQRVINEAQQTDFNVLTSGSHSAPRYFDDQGTEVRPANSASLSASERARIIYWVNTQVQAATSIPYTTGTAQLNENLATVTIQVVNNPGNVPITSGSNGLWNDERFSIFSSSGLVSQSKPQ